MLLFMFGLVVSTLLNVRVTRQILSNELAKRAETLLRSVQQKCQYAVTVIDRGSGEVYVDRRSLDDIVRDIREDEPDVVQVLIVDRDERVLSSLDPARRDRPLAQSPFIPGCCASGGPQQVLRERTDNLEVMGPVLVNGYDWGKAFISFSLEPMRHEIGRLSLQSLAIGALFMLVGLVLTITLVHALLRPIKRLSAHAVAIGDGDLDQHIEVSGHDEIGQLALAFRSMIARLKATLVDLERGMRELRHSQACLQISEKKYRDIVEHAFEGIFQVAPDGSPIDVNPAMARMLGYRDAEALCQAVPDLAAQFASPGDRRAFQRGLAEDGRVIGFETRLSRPDGTLVDCVLSARAVCDERGRVNLIEGSVFDVTERIERERAERETAAAKASSEAKSAFLATMSHELRTPMNAIIGFADLALRTGPGPQQAGYVQRIRDAAEALLHLINDILDFSKIEAGQLELEVSDFELEDVLHRSLGTIALQAEDKGLEVLVDLDPAMPMQWRGDALRLEQVLVNLLSNAVKFTSAGRIVLRVRVQPDDEGQLALDASVTDTGIGVSDEQRARLFSAFSQADSSTTRRFGGTGLGLAICKELVQLMQGRIEISSRLGEGSRVRFSVRLQRPASAQRSEPMARSIQVPVSVWLIDADPDSRALLRGYLEHVGYRCRADADLEPLMAGPGLSEPAAVLIHYRDDASAAQLMSEQLRRLSARPQQDRAPLLLICGERARSLLSQQEFAAGIDAFIAKPVLPGALCEQLAAVLNGPDRAPQPSAARHAAVEPPHEMPTAMAPRGDSDPGYAPAPQVCEMSVSPLERNAVILLLQRLQHELDQDLRSALRTLDELEPLFRTSAWHGAFQRLQSALKVFEVDLAREHLADLEKQFGAPLE
ncbi:hybrid sensor histidine kinase/response regulator [Halochromatium glycolicum]|nr:ATP-binding protein [Halochromatium glycolicum]